MTYNEQTIGINPLVPVVAFTITLLAMSETPVNITVNSTNVETQNIGYLNSKGCIFPSGRRKSNENAIGQIEYSELDSTNAPIFIDVKSTPSIIANVAVNEKIKELSAIDNNWDGYNGYAPTQQVLINIAQFLQSLPEKHLLNIDEENIYPNPNGTITVKWESELGKVSIEIGNITAAFFSFINNVYDKQEKMSTLYLSDKFISALNDLTRD